MKHLSLSHRLKLGFACVLSLLLCIAAVSTLTLRQAGRDMKIVVEVNATRSELANALLVNIGNMATTVRTVALLTDLKAVDRAAESLRQLDAECIHLENTLRKHLDQWGAQPEELALMDAVIEASRKTRPVIAEAAKLGSDGDNTAAVNTMTTRVAPLEQVWRTQVEKFAALQKSLSTSVVLASTTRHSRVISIQLGLVIVSLLGGAFIAWRITKSVTTPITRMQNTMTEITTSQDFSRRVTVDQMDEIGLSIMAFNAMIENIQEGSTQLARKTADIEAMNKDLSASLEQLKIVKDELVRREKLAALGSLVAGIAHELNTPIGNGLLAMSTLRDEVSALRQDMATKGLQRKTFDTFLATIDNSTDITERSLNRSAELVRSFKELSLDQATDNRRSFSVKEQVEGILLMLQPTLKRMPYKVETCIVEDLTMDSYPGALAQIVTNLVNNALIHGFDGRDSGTINIRVERAAPGFLMLRIADDGKGIAENAMPRIFDPFFTTKMGQGGSGLGLHIVYNVATITLGGTIDVTSSLGHGTECRLTFPLCAPHPANQA
ncbi:MAG: ATP-binding protein [Pseudomonadota bacterium]